MPQSLGNVYVHLLVSTREGRPFLADRSLRRGLHGYLTGICRNLECPSLRIGGIDDHVHVLLRLSREQAIARLVQELKEGSTSWLRSQRRVKDFNWQDGYSAFSVSPENVGKAVRYIENQAKLHRNETFADEYRGLLQKCGGHPQRTNVHLVFSTKNRFPFLSDKNVRRLLHDQLAEICDSLDCPALRVGGVEDHVHILYRLSQGRELAEVSREVKKTSSTWLVTRRDIRNFDWQDGYGAFSVSPQHEAAVMRYIESQEEHHRHETFAEECRRFLRIKGSATRTE